MHRFFRSLLKPIGSFAGYPPRNIFWERLRSGSFDFIDFGCSKGGSLAFGHRKLGGENGVGVDLRQEKVELTRQAGFEAYVADARDLDLFPDAVRFATMIDFLEHLPGFADAANCIEAACSVAREFVFIRQPWFDSDGYLLSNGLKLYWSDWRGHPNAMSSLELFRIVSRIPRVKHWRIYARGPIGNSDDPAVLPAGSPIDQSHWNPGLHDPKPSVRFDQPVYRQIGCIALTLDEPEKFAELEMRAPWDAVLLASDPG